MNSLTFTKGTPTIKPERLFEFLKTSEFAGEKISNYFRNLTADSLNLQLPLPIMPSLSSSPSSPLAVSSSFATAGAANSLGLIAAQSTAIERRQEEKKSSFHGALTSLSAAFSSATAGGLSSRSSSSSSSSSSSQPSHPIAPLYNQSLAQATPLVNINPTTTTPTVSPSATTTDNSRSSNLLPRSPS
jgi:hypothetical protein